MSECDKTEKRGLPERVSDEEASGNSFRAKPHALRGHFRKDSAFILILLAIVVVIWLPRLNGPIDLRWDAGVYYILGTSLAEGKGYRLLNEPGDIEATQYPPLLPAIVAIHQWILGTNDPLRVGSWLRVFFFLVFITYTFAIYWMARRYLSLGYAFLLTVVCIFGLQTSFLSDLCVPEILFGMATVLAVLFNRNDGRRVYLIFSILLGIASYALRTFGIAFFAAWVGEALLTRKFKRAGFRLALALIPILSWYSYVTFVEAGQQYRHPVYGYQRADYLFYNVSYARNMTLKDPFKPELGRGSFGDLTYRFLRNLARLPRNLGETISAPIGIWSDQWAWLDEKLPFHLQTWWLIDFVPIVLGSLVLVGTALQLSVREWIMPLYVLIYLAGICVAPWPKQFLRYMMPLTPFLALSLFKCLANIQDLSQRIPFRKCKAFSLLFTGSVVLVILIQQSFTFFLLYSRWHQPAIYEDDTGANIEYRLFFYSEIYQAQDAGLDWLKKRAKPGDVVAATMPHWVYLRTGLKAVMPPFEADPAKGQTLLDSVPIRYVIIDDLKLEGNVSGKYASPLVRDSSDVWRKIYSAPRVRFEIYERVSSRPPLGEGISKTFRKSGYPG